jgi:hypothetical protein
MSDIAFTVPQVPAYTSPGYLDFEFRMGYRAALPDIGQNHQKMA